MSGDGFASDPDPQSQGGMREAFGAPGEPDALLGGVWNPDFDAVSGVGAENLFAAELENVDASAWDIDEALIWGEDGAGAPGDDGGAAAFDFPL